MTLETLRLSWSEGCNIVIGQSHFIKTVEDLGEIMAASVPGAAWGLAFNEASGPCLVRSAGSDEKLVAEAINCARTIGAGHSFYLILGQGCFPINVLDRIKSCPEVCGIFCATANPLEVIVARTEQGAGILGVIDGFSPKGVEGPADKAERSALLRRFGYKFA
ncbi:MAG TPA: adenosine-specific kinase [Rectinemataceae bacterium]|nr:adenosine-specific kinase [Rectinemataceae bacterium]